MKRFILVIDDEPDIRDLVKDILEDEGYQVSTAQDGASARRALRERRPDLILLDIWMPDIDGISLLREWDQEGGLPCPVVMMSGHGTVETAVEATRLGAYDYLEKPLSLAKLLLTVERALETDRLRQENVGLRGQLVRVLEPVGNSAAIQRLREQAKRVAQHDSWVLITGEAGSGKQTLAHYIHDQSSRKELPFIVVNVGSLSSENASRELFGSETDGHIRYGRLEEASGGTLFLDEVAEMDLEAQALLAATLDNGYFVRVGGTDAIPVNVRIIAASQRDLEREVELGRLREDLYFHLNVVPLKVPSLVERREDVPQLLTSFVDQYVAHENLHFRQFSTGAQNFLRNYHWPGNIRELSNLVQRLLIMGEGEMIEQDEVETALGAVSQETMKTAERAKDIFDRPLREAREAFERAYLEHQLEKHQGNVSKMSQEVGMERTHLYRKLRAVGIEIKERR